MPERPTPPPPAFKSPPSEPHPSRVAGTLEPRASARSLIAVVVIALAITSLWVALSPRFAVTWDEKARHAYGVKVLQFWRGELSYDVFVRRRPYMYASLFDTTAALLHEHVGGDLWTVRHALNAFVGGVGVLGAGLAALRLFGTWPAVVAMLLLASSPRYVGDSMNNPKDLPFAAACSLALAAMTLVRPRFPFLTWRRALIVGLALAVALNVRPGALIYLGFAWALLAALTMRARAWTSRELLVTAGHAALITGVTLIAGTAFWPWAQLNPFVRPFQALLRASDFEWKGATLFLGHDVAATNLPWDYVPVWMTITTPPVVLAGVLLAVWSTGVEPRQRLRRLALWTAALLPIVLVIVRGSTLYDGWRHLLFTYPPLVVLAASGWVSAARAAASRRRELAIVVTAVLIVGCLEPVVFMVRNHPHEIVYFSPLIGGPRGAFRRFEMDYWGSSLSDAMRWSALLARRSGLPLAVAGTPREIVAANAWRESALYAPFPWEGRHHLDVKLLRLSSGQYARLVRGDALYVVRMEDGTPLAAVYPGPRFADVAAKVLPHVTEATKAMK